MGRDDPEAPLFYTKTGKMVRASDLYMRLRVAMKRLGINIRIYPHLLRHYRATELYGKLSEKEMMQWFGWSTRFMIDIYSHVKETRAVERVLSIYGLNNGADDLEYAECPRCHTRNPADARYCYRCGSPITIESAVDRESEVEELIHSIEWRVEGDSIVFVVPSRTTKGRKYPVVVSRRDWRVLDHSPCPAWLKGIRCWHLKAVEKMLAKVEGLIEQGYTRGIGYGPLADEGRGAEERGVTVSVPAYAKLVYAGEEIEALVELAKGLAQF